jgi:RNA polymerase sigma-70 factor (ECF subfamily)
VNESPRGGLGHFPGADAADADRRGPEPSGADPVSLDLRRAGAGDEQAFARVFDSLSPMVFGVAVRVVRADALAEEVAQDVFVEAWRLAPQFDPTRGSARAWLATIAHRRAVDRVRSEQSRRNREQNDSRYVTRPHDGVSEAVLDQLDRRQLTAAFGVLSDVQRQAIELAYYEGRTYRDVAVLLGIAEGTAKTRIREGLHRLRAAMGAMA